MPTPPPYTGITGLYLPDDKHVSVTRSNYDGVSRPGQLVVDTQDYSLWVGDDTGALNLLATPSGFYPAYTVNTLTGSTYTLALGDVGKMLYGSNITVSVPTNTSVAFDTGSYITIATGSDVVILEAVNPSTSIYLSNNVVAGDWIIPARSVARLYKVEQEVWYLDGAGIVSL